MAEPERILTINSAAAYDRYYQNTQPEYRPQGLPEDRPLPQKQKRVKAQTAVAPFAIFGVMAAVCMLVLVIFGYVQLFEATDYVDTLQHRLEREQQTQSMLKSKYESRIDLHEIEQRAARLGLSRPTAEQTVYLSITGGDSAEIYKQQKTNVFAQLFSALEQSVMELIAYLRPAAA